MSSETVKEFIVGIGFIIADVLLFQHLSLFGAVADPLLIYLLWIALKYDRLQLVLFAAALGFMQDALFDFWGLNMFSKTLLCFIAFNFLNRRNEGRLVIWQVFLIIGIAALFHNLIFLGLANFVEAYSTGFSPVIFVIGNSLYTAVLGSLLFIFKGN